MDLDYSAVVGRILARIKDPIEEAVLEVLKEMLPDNTDLLERVASSEQTLREVERHLDVVEGKINEANGQLEEAVSDQALVQDAVRRLRTSLNALKGGMVRMVEN